MHKSDQQLLTEILSCGACGVRYTNKSGLVSVLLYKTGGSGELKVPESGAERASSLSYIMNMWVKCGVEGCGGLKGSIEHPQEILQA